MYNEKTIKTIHLVLTITEILNDIDINKTSLKDMRRQLELKLGMVENSLDERQGDIKFIVKHIIKRKKNKQSWEEKYKLLEQEKNVILPVRSRHLKKQVETLTNENETLLKHINMIRLKNNQLQGKCDELQGDNGGLQEEYDELQEKYNELEEYNDTLQGDNDGLLEQLDEKWKINMDMYKLTGCYYDADSKIDYDVIKQAYLENIIDPIIDY